MPIGSAIPQVTMMAPIESRMVSQSRSPITSMTGRPNSNETPNSPRDDQAQPLDVLDQQRLVEAVGLPQRRRLLHR